MKNFKNANFDAIHLNVFLSIQLEPFVMMVDE